MISRHFQPFGVEIVLLRAGGANTNETNGFHRYLEVPKSDFSEFHVKW